MNEPYVCDRIVVRWPNRRHWEVVKQTLTGPRLDTVVSETVLVRKELKSEAIIAAEIARKQL